MLLLGFKCVLDCFFKIPVKIFKKCSQEEIKKRKTKRKKIKNDGHDGYTIGSEPEAKSLGGKRNSFYLF